MKLLLLFTQIILSNIKNSECHCTFPTDWSGSWYSSEFGSGEVALDATTMTVSSGWNITSFHSWTCQNYSGNILIFHADQTVPGTGFTVGAVRCIAWTKLTESSYSYVVYNDVDNVNGYRVKLATTPLSSDMQASCSPNSSPSAEEFHVLVKTGSSSLAAVECPSFIQGRWEYEHQNNGATSCRASSSLNVCGTMTDMDFNYQKCNKTQAFSDSGAVNCIHTTTNNTSQHSFTIVLNTDKNVDSSATHRFTCFAFVQNGSVILASDSAGSCNAGQTPTTQQTDGSGTLRLTKSGDCPVTEPGSGQTEVIIGSVIGVIVFIVCISIAVYFVIRRQKLKQSVIHEDGATGQRSHHSQNEATEITLLKYTGILPTKQPQPDTEKPTNVIDKILGIFQFQSSKKTRIDSAVMLGRLRSRIHPDTPEPVTKLTVQRDEAALSLDQPLNGMCPNCRQIECFCNPDREDGVGAGKTDSMDNVTNGPYEGNSEISNDEDIERNQTKITEEQRDKEKTTNISEPSLPDTFTETESAQANNYEFAQKDKRPGVNITKIVEDKEKNHLNELLNERDPKEFDDERDRDTDSTSGATQIRDKSESDNESQFDVNAGNQRTENRDPGKGKSLEDSTFPEKQNITDRQTDAKNDDESNASNVSKLSESLAKKMHPKLSGVKLNLSLSSNQRTPKISQSETFNSEKLIFEINNDDATGMAPGAKHERKKGSILLTDFANSKSGQKTVSFDM